MSWWSAILPLLYLVSIIAMFKVLTDNRQPVKTMAWLMVLGFLPGLGIILYFFFGRNIRKQRMISERSMNQLTKRSMIEFAEQKELRLPESHKALFRLFYNQNMAFPFKDNRVEILTSGHDFFLTLLRDIGAARHHIHVDSYIFEDDPLGRLVADALKDKARQGVEVRVIYDDVGCWRVDSDFFESMREAGIDVHAFMPVKFPAFTSKMNYRNHRKITVIDGQTGYVGGMNIALRYVKGTGDQPWRDTHLRVTGGAVYGIQRAFLIDWYFVDRTLLSGQQYYPPLEEGLSNNCIAQMVTSSPVSPQPEIMQGYLRILMAARRYVFLESPYFLPTETILLAMRTAATSGVDVRLMLPLRSDARFVAWASRSYIREVVESGVKVLFYQGGFNHSKLLVADDCLSSCGSTNIDFRSFENNFESNIFFYDEGMALRMKSLFLKDEKQCVGYETWQNGFQGRWRVFDRLRPMLTRLWESVARVFAPLL